MNKPLVIGLGNSYRSDDALGIEIVKNLETTFEGKIQAYFCAGNTIDLLEIWKGCSTVFIVDAIESNGGEIGSLHCFSPRNEKIPAIFTNSSTHLLDIVQVIELGEALGNLPDFIKLYGIEANSFAMGSAISEKLKDRISAIEKIIENEIREQLYRS